MYVNEFFLAILFTQILYWGNDGENNIQEV